MRSLVASLFIVFAFPAFASQPGQPLDCSDWVFLAPGLSCAPWIPYPCPRDVLGRAQPPCDRGVERAFDNAGRVLRVRYAPGSSACETDLHRTELVAATETGDVVLGYVDDRCHDTNRSDRIGPIGGGLLFDALQGRTLVFLNVNCTNCNYPAGDTVLSITGLATLFDVLHSYQPPVDQFGFTVSQHPEGFRTADNFDSYWGTVTQPLDLANAHPLQCGYPTSAPKSGDYLRIVNPVPRPQPGAANYVLTTTTYQGETRAGQKRTGGTATGRDATRLPTCAPSEPTL